MKQSGYIFEDKFMTNTLKISGITKEQLFERVHHALEDSMKSPINKKSVINRAMVNILHGGHSSGQNEHNLDQFFQETEKKSIYWEVVENIYYETNDEPDCFAIHQGETEKIALQKMYASVILETSSDIAQTISLTDFSDYLSNRFFVYDFNFSQEQDEDFEFESMDEDDIEKFLNSIENEKPDVVKFVFEYIMELSEIKGTFQSFEKEYFIENYDTVKEIEVKETPLPKIYTTIIQHMIDDEDLSEHFTINDIEVINTLSESEHNKLLLNLFRQHAPENEDSKYLILESDTYEEMLKDNDFDEDELENFDIEKLIEIMCEYVQPNELIECISSFSMNMVNVEVQYTN